MLISSFKKAIHNLLLPDIIKLFLICIIAYMLGFGLLLWLLVEAFASYIGFSGSEGFIVHMVGSLGGITIAWLFFPLLYPILISFFDDKIAETIEREDYPSLPPAQPPFWPTIASDAWFSLKAVALNIICLPLYLTGIGMFVYYGMNGYLLGKQFFRMAAGRRANEVEVRALEKKAGSAIFLIGLAITFSATVPFLNLVAPVLGVAVMLHLFHEVYGTNKQQILDPL